MTLVTPVFENGLDLFRKERHVSLTLGGRAFLGGPREGHTDMASTYQSLFTRSLTDPEGFWAAAAEDIYWDQRWDRVLDRSREPFHRWFVGGKLNTCFNAIDLHIERGRAKQIALVYDSPVTGTIQTFTYAALRDEIARFAGALRRHGIQKGDRVIVYMERRPRWPRKVRLTQRGWRPRRTER